MTHFSDGISIGGAFTNTVVGSSGGFGMNTAQDIAIDIVPITKNTAAFTASGQSAASGGAITLSANGSGISAVVVGNVTRYYQDCVRGVTISSAGNDSGITFTVSGGDFYGQPQTQTITGANTGTATSLKTFAYITSAVANGATASTVNVGTADLFGLPIRLIDKGYVDCLGWNNAAGTDTGTLTVADTTTPATALTGDVRGTYVPSSASNGSRRLVVAILANAAQLGAGPSTAATTAILGVTPA